MPVFPGLAAQAKYRHPFRIGGAVVFLIGAGLTLIGFLAFISMFKNASDFSGDSSGFNANFLWAFLGLPTTAFGAALLQAGFLGAGSRYVAGETMPVI